MQRAHMEMARRKRPWPAFVMPAQRGSMTAVEVIAVPEGPQRDAAIDVWCRSVWDAWSVNRPAVEALLREYGIA